jgi:hypothetical protein
MNRTNQQNRALHLWFDMVAEALNDAGYDMRKTLKPGVEIPWTKETIKDYLWRPVQMEYLRKRSTTELSTKDIDKVYDILNRHLVKFGIHTPFPSLDELIWRENSKEKL